MNRIKVESGEYKIYDMKDDHALYTVNLDRDIAFTLCCVKLRKIALARNLNDQQCIQFFHEISKTNVMDECVFDAYFIGGNSSTKSKQYAEHLLRLLFYMDGDLTINILDFGVGDRIHPNSFEMDCSDGTLRILF
jgi:hypothetical protein